MNSAAAPTPLAARRGVWFFDLDDTLHRASLSMFQTIDARMTRYLQQHLDLSHDQADELRSRYWLRYGATLLGLVRHHRINADHFLRETHDFDIESHLQSESGLRTWGLRLPGRKVLLTNAPSHYAHRVIRGIGLAGIFDERIAVENMRVHGHYRPKPSRLLFRAMRVRQGLCGNGPRPILVDDNLANLKAAHSCGFITVLLANRGNSAFRRPGQARRLPGQAYVDLRLRTVKQLHAHAHRLASHTASA